MKTKIYIFLLLFGFSHTAILQAQLVDFCDTNEINCIDGEELTYKLYYKLGFLWVPTGEVVFRSSESTDFYTIEAEGKTYGAYDPIFKVRDHFYSKIDKASMKPVEFIRNVHEGNYRRYFRTVFDYNQGLAISQQGKTNDNTSSIECSISEYCIQDVLSILYQLRSIAFNDLEKGDNFDLDIFMDNKVYDVNLFYNGIVNDKHIRNLGKFNTHMLIPETIAGNIFDDDDKMKIWVSNDKNRVPLMIESPISVGSIRAVLKSHKGLATKLGQ